MVDFVQQYPVSHSNIYSICSVSWIYENQINTTVNQLAVGSIPTASTKFFPHLLRS